MALLSLAVCSCMSTATCSLTVANVTAGKAEGRGLGGWVGGGGIWGGDLGERECGGGWRGRSRGREGGGGVGTVGGY